MELFHNLRRPTLLVAILVVAALLMATVSPAFAAPGRADVVQTTAQNVDYLTPETASSLALDFSVLVPPFVPAPFGGEPAISAGGGYYSLYWMVGGGDPTLLQVTGEVGGALPAGSPYDLNNQLFVNASVQGYEAIHDVTPIYDIVWWIAGGVLYKVESRNMQGTDSLSLANGLVALVPPAVPEVPAVEPEPEVPTDGNDPDPGPIDENVEEPIEDDTGPDAVTTDDEVAGETSEESDPAAPSTETQAEPTAEDEPTAAEPEGAEDDAVKNDPAASDPPAGDGTGGPPAPVSGSDGTGGTNELVVPPGGRGTP